MNEVVVAIMIRVPVMKGTVKLKYDYPASWNGSSSQDYATWYRTDTDKTKCIYPCVGLYRDHFIWCCSFIPWMLFYIISLSTSYRWYLFVSFCVIISICFPWQVLHNIISRNRLFCTKKSHFEDHLNSCYMLEYQSRQSRLLSINFMNDQNIESTIDK